jgi:hypothetical protein
MAKETRVIAVIRMDVVLPEDIDGLEIDPVLDTICDALDMRDKITAYQIEEIRDVYGQQLWFAIPEKRLRCLY